MKPIIFLALFFLTHCVTTAVWMEKNYQPEKKGRLYYDPTPNLFDSNIVQKRRYDAEIKMKTFCNPLSPSIVKEESKEEVTGHATEYSSSAVNPAPAQKSHSVYYKDKQTTAAESRHSSQGPAWLSSQSSSVTSAITRNRVYIDFVCK